MPELPKPDYQRDASDPDWLAFAAQFHGHLGPWATAGLRAGMCARRAVEANGFFDVEVAVEGPLVGPPPSCMLDGLQVSTGATLGKRNLTWTNAERLVIRVKNTRTGRATELRPTSELWEMLVGLKTSSKTAAERDTDHDAKKAAQHEAVEARARRIAKMTEASLFVVTFPGHPKGEAGGNP